MNTRPRIPATILSGYLGSGKTSAINALLAADTGKRIAVLVNDFGAINIDATLIESQEDQTISLKNGCVCCSIADDLSGALTAQTLREEPPDHIVLEASGVSEPTRISKHVGGWPGIALCKTVSVVDASTIRQRATDKFVGSLVRRQISAADALVLSKMDLISEPQREALRPWLRGLNAHAQILEAEFGVTEPDTFFSAAFNAVCGDGLSEVSGNKLAHDLHAAEWNPCGPVDLRALVRIVDALPRSIHRIKGFVSDAENGETVLLQRAGDTCSTETLLSEKTIPPIGVVLIVAGDNVSTSDVLEKLEASVQDPRR